MKCKKFRPDIVLYLYDELNNKDKEQLEAHLSECPECALEMTEMRNVFHLVDKTHSGHLPSADWDKCWHRISNHLTRTSPKPKFKPFVRWTLAAASALIVFALGIFFGRMWISGPDSGPVTVSSQSAYAVQLRDYIGSVKPVLLDYSNQAQPNGETVVIDAAFLTTMLLQNYVLKQMVAEQDLQAAQMLEDLELVLREVINKTEDDPANSEMIRDLIKQRNILFKMDVLQKI